MDKGMRTEQSWPSPLTTYTRWIWVWILGVVIGVPMMGVVYASGVEFISAAIIRSAISYLSGEGFQNAILVEVLNRVILSLIPGMVVGAIVGFMQSIILNYRTFMRRWILMSI